MTTILYFHVLNILLFSVKATAFNAWLACKLSRYQAVYAAVLMYSDDTAKDCLMERVEETLGWVVIVFLLLLPQLAVAIVSSVVLNIGST